MNSFFSKMSFFNNLRILTGDRNFILLWFAQALSVFCAMMLNFVLAYIITTKTNSAFHVSLLFLFYGLPVPILGLFAGIFVDYFSRRKILILTNFLQAIVVLLYLGVDNAWWIIYPVIFVYSLIDEFYYPAISAMIVTVTPKRSLPIANFLFLMASYGAMALGFSSAGEVIKMIGTKNTFVVASVLLFTAMIFSFFLKKDQVQRDISHLKEDTINKIGKEIKSNYRYIFGNKMIYSTMLILLIYQITVGTLAIASPKIGTQILGYNFLDLGMRFIMPIFLGAIIATVVVDRFFHGNRKKLIIVGMYGSALSIGIMSLLSKYSFTVYPILMMVLIFLGFNAMIVLLTGQTIIQQETPKEIMGRVSGTYKLFQSVLILIPNLLTGALIDYLGVLPVMYGLVIIITIISTIAFLKRNHNFRKVEN